MATTSDPRKLLAASRKSRRITSPYASYSLAGALFCNICSNTPIKSESLWESHVASPGHKANVLKKGNIGGKSNKRPAESPSESPARGAAAGVSTTTTANKRVKTANPDFKNLTLPVGFFDDSDDDDDQAGVVSTGEEVIEPDDEPAAATTTSKSKLPADFFASSNNASASHKQSPATVVVNTVPDDAMDDEWAAFQADIASTEHEEGQQVNEPNHINHTISAPAVSAAELAAHNQDDPAAGTGSRSTRLAAEEEDIEDAKAAMVEFFDEQSTLEERVQRLKQRREMLRKGGAVDGGSMQPPMSTNNTMATATTANGFGSGAARPARLDRSNSVPSVKMGGMDDASVTSGGDRVGNGGVGSDDDEDYDDDENMFFRRR